MTADLLRSLVHEWYDPLYRFAYSLCRTHDDALDLTQNAFHKLALKGHHLRDTSKAKSWLFSTLHREFIDQYRRKTRFPATPLESVPEPANTLGVSLSERLDATALLDALEELEEPYRAPLILFYLKSLSYAEIAETLEIPIGTVMSRLRRGKDRLRARFESGAYRTESATPANPIPFNPKPEAHHG